jgi:hypothetical protein
VEAAGRVQPSRLKDHGRPKKRERLPQWVLVGQRLRPRPAEGSAATPSSSAGRTETLVATLGDVFSDPLPVVGTSFEIGNELAALLEQGEVVIRLKTET